MHHHQTNTKERITLVDLDCRGLEHEFYNSACLLSIRYARPAANITVSARQAHLHALKNRLALISPDVKFMPLDPEVVHGSGLLHLYKSLQTLLKRVLLPSPEPIVDTIVFLSCSIRSFIVMKWVALYWPSVRFVIIFHGLLERLEYHDKTKFKLSNWLLRAVFSYRTSNNISYCVLGRGILEKLQSTVGRVSTPCVAIDSPYLFDESAASGSPDGGSIVFGHLGYAHAAKGFLNFIAVAKALSHRPSLTFRVVGGTDRSDPRVNQAPELDYVLHDWPVPRGQYEAALADVTYAVFLYPPGSYRLRASGALFDAIAAGKPVIALRNPYFDHVFKAVGDMGYLCDDMDDLIRVCREVAQRFPRERYQQQQQNLAMARVRFSPASIAEQWNTQFFDAQPERGST